MRTFTRLFVVASLFLVAYTSWGQDKEKEQRIVELLELSGSGDIGKQYFVAIIDQFRGILPEVPSAFWDEAKETMDPNELVAIIVPIYDRHFTLEEIEELIVFYKSPIGQKLVKEQPMIMEESMKAGEIWGEEFAQRIIEKLEKSGY